MNRSSAGCWTCRIRHRKCDEKRPLCRECTDRSIRCHGYGAKPDWVDDEWALRAELSRLKRAVNLNAREARKKRHAKGETNQIASAHNLEPGAASAANGSATAHDSEVDDGLVPNTQSKDTAPGCTFREAQLLMNYVDYIFPLQYPYYQDDPTLGGRGWLLWLLMKRGPLYQAVLTLSALHHHTQFPQASHDRESELFEYHTNALQRLRQVLEDSDAERFTEDRERIVEFLACGSSLISFELFQGGRSNWQHHLRAMTSVTNKLPIPPNPQQNGKTESQEDGGVKSALPFMISKVIWLDILASTTTGSIPHTDYRQWLNCGQIDLSRIMGCENWVMEVIGVLAAVDSRRKGSDFVEADIDQLEDIEKELELGITKLKSKDDKDDPQKMIATITEAFAIAALVLTHMVYPEARKQKIDSCVSRMIQAIRKLPDSVSLRGLAWPMCVVGCVAPADRQLFFEVSMLEVVNKLGPGYTNCGTVLDVLRRCWKHRKEQPNDIWSWRDGMADMRICALLV